MSNTLVSEERLSYLVVDYKDEVGQYGIYKGSYEDCVAYVQEMAKHDLCIGIKIVPDI